MPNTVKDRFHLISPGYVTITCIRHGFGYFPKAPRNIEPTGVVYRCPMSSCDTFVLIPFPKEDNEVPRPNFP